MEWIKVSTGWVNLANVGFLDLSEVNDGAIVWATGDRLNLASKDDVEVLNTALGMLVSANDSINSRVHYRRAGRKAESSPESGATPTKES